MTSSLDTPLDPNEALGLWARPQRTMDATQRKQRREEALGVARTELDAIVARQGPDAFATLAWPSQALGNAALVRLLIEAGLRSPVALAHDGFMPQNADHTLPLRRAACYLATADVHRLLDGIGIPAPSEEEAVHWGANLAQQGKISGLDYLFRVQPERMAALATAPQSKLGLILAGLWETWRKSKPKQAQSLLEFGDEHSMNWTLFVNGVQNKPDVLAEFSEALAHAKARALNRELAPVAEPQRGRPRL